MIFESCKPSNTIPKYSSIAHEKIYTIDYVDMGGNADGEYFARVFGAL